MQCYRIVQIQTINFAPGSNAFNKHASNRCKVNPTRRIRKLLASASVRRLFIWSAYFERGNSFQSFYEVFTATLSLIKQFGSADFLVGGWEKAGRRWLYIRESINIGSCITRLLACYNINDCTSNKEVKWENFFPHFLKKDGVFEIMELLVVLCLFWKVCWRFVGFFFCMKQNKYWMCLFDCTFTCTEN